MNHHRNRHPRTVPLLEGRSCSRLPPVPGKTVVITGCGTSYYLAQSDRRCLQPRRPHGASPCRAPNGRAAREIISPPQDGICVDRAVALRHHTETVQAIEASRKAGMRTIAISCETDSTILRAADEPCLSPTHPSEGIVMTVVGQPDAACRPAHGGRRARPGSQRGRGGSWNGRRGHCVPLIRGRTHFVYLGAGPLYGMATEGCLKLQEMSITYQPVLPPDGIPPRPDQPDRRKLRGRHPLFAGHRCEEEARVAGIAGQGGRGHRLRRPRRSAKSLAQSGDRPRAGLPARAADARRAGGELQKNVDTDAPRHLSKVVVLG